MHGQYYRWLTTILVLLLAGCAGESGRDDAKPIAQHENAQRQEEASAQQHDLRANDVRQTSPKAENIVEEKVEENAAEKKETRPESSSDLLDALLDGPDEPKAEPKVDKQDKDSPKGNQPKSPEKSAEDPEWLSKVPKGELVEVEIGISDLPRHTYRMGRSKARVAQIRLIRLEYAGGDWKRYFGVLDDDNMLVEYQIRTKHETAKKTESRTISQLKNFPLGKTPPLMLITGSKNISLTESEVKLLREYLLDKKGMLFVVNGGGKEFQESWTAVMKQVLPTVKPVVVPLDDPIHRRPYPLTPMSTSEAEAGTNWGWYDDDRLVCYFSSADLLHAWSEAGEDLPSDKRDLAYRYGVNVIFYAYQRYGQWAAQRETDKKLDSLLETP